MSILFSWTGITFILGVIEGVIYLVMDEVAFDVKYNQTLASPLTAMGA
jgi:TM2 domain-containing membrane protein YozV